MPPSPRRHRRQGDLSVRRRGALLTRRRAADACCHRGPRPLARDAGALRRRALLASHLPRQRAQRPPASALPGGGRLRHMLHVGDLRPHDSRGARLRHSGGAAALRGVRRAVDGQDTFRVVLRLAIVAFARRRPPLRGLRHLEAVAHGQPDQSELGRRDGRARPAVRGRHTDQPAQPRRARLVHARLQPVPPGRLVHRAHRLAAARLHEQGVPAAHLRAGRVDPMVRGDGGVALAPRASGGGGATLGVARGSRHDANGSPRLKLGEEAGMRTRSVPDNTMILIERGIPCQSCLAARFLVPSR
mmetsp:Transcript_42714/g.97981  ORF Transcript_42714/g.97981 Transcript_42714/m.97981 type:complete len:302 (-) Transcript_42714:314-1219(-)